MYRKPRGREREARKEITQKQREKPAGVQLTLEVETDLSAQATCETTKANAKTPVRSMKATKKAATTEEIYI